MTTKASTEGQKASSSVSKGFSYTQALVTTMVLAGAYFYVNKFYTLDRFSQALSEQLCDATQKSAFTEANRHSSYNPKLPSGKSYNAKDAMDARHLKLQEVCNKYGDPMIPEYSMQSHVPPSTSFVIYPKEKIAFCGLSGVAKTGFAGLFERIRKADDPDTSDYAGFHNKDTYHTTHRKYKKAIFVRHPMERLISVYRKTLAGALNAETGESEEGMSFENFIYVILHGPVELAEYIQQNHLEGQSLGIDTGMVDGKGMSRAWAPYWQQCGLCNLKFRPHYILHFDHAKDDQEVLVELLGNNEEAKKWLQVNHNHVAAKEDILQHFWSQISKEDIKGVYQKYKVDFEIFGYSPDWYIQLGKE